MSYHGDPRSKKSLNNPGKELERHPMDSLSFWQLKEKILQEQLACWTQVREHLKGKVLDSDPNGQMLLRYVKALEIATDEEIHVLSELDPTDDEHVLDEEALDEENL
jgi:hypothetical protein